MTIATLEKIHELLKNECWTKQRAQEIALKKLHNKEDFVEELAAAADDKNDPSLVEAVKAVDTAKAAYNEAIKKFFAAQDALRDFEAQGF